MLYVDRGQNNAPLCLTDERTVDGRAMLDEMFGVQAQWVVQSRIDMSSTAVRGSSLDVPLSELFSHRCAFCERRTPTSAYRFRPSEEAGPSSQVEPRFADRSHLYYTWLTNAWRNLYPVCDDCLPRELSIFPVVGKRCPLPEPSEIETYTKSRIASWPFPINERPLLLDPCEDRDFRRHLILGEGFKLIGRRERGVFTIDHFDLNRQRLIEHRENQLMTYVDRLCDASLRGGDIKTLFEFENLEFGGCWYLLLYQLALFLTPEKRNPALTRDVIILYYRSRLKEHSFAGSVRNALSGSSPMWEHETARKVPHHGRARPIGFHIRNFKALELVTISLNAKVEPSFLTDAETDAPGLVILGENAAGKSSVLEAMALALSNAPTRRSLKLDHNLFVLRPDWMGAQASPAVERSSVAVQYEDNTHHTVSIEAGFPTVGGSDEGRIPVFAYGAFRMFLKGKREASSSGIRSLFHSDYVLPNPEQWLASLADTPLYQEVVRNLKFILAVDQKVDLIEVDEARACWLTVNTERDDGTSITVRTPLSAVSSGFRAVLAMACDIMRRLATSQDRFSASLARARAVVLIDEVEAHLHPKWKMQIIHGLRRALPNVTFIVTTHDPLCLRGVSTQEVRVFRRLERRSPSASSIPVFVEQLDDFPAMSALTVEQLLTSDLFELHSTDSPELDTELARAGDLLAREHARTKSEGIGLSSDDAAVLERVRKSLQVQIGKSLPIGSTEVERLVQEAVEAYLVARRNMPHQALKGLRQKTRDEIVRALGSL